MTGKLTRAPGLFLAGFMGSGKSTVGRLIAEQFGWDFIDLDTVIEQEEGRPISELFATLGEDIFRRIEHDALKREVRAAERGHPRVVAMGGGAFVQQDNRELLLDTCTVVWLDAPAPVLLERIRHETHRPLARDHQRFLELYEERRPAYELADFQVDAEGEAQAVAERVLELPLW
jgi:shikimate kinase